MMITIILRTCNLNHPHLLMCVFLCIHTGSHEGAEAGEGAAGGWCCPPKPLLDVEGEGGVTPEDHPAPPPSPPLKRSLSLKPVSVNYL